MLHSISDENYLIPLQNRLAWLKKLMLSYGLVTLVFLGIIFYIVFTGLYTITGNFIYTMALGVMIYLIAWQAISNNNLLKPGFAAKYNSTKLSSAEEEIFLKVLQLLEQDKVFIDPDLKIAGLAKMANTNPHCCCRALLMKSSSKILVNY